MTGAAPVKSRTGAGRRTWWPQLGCDGSPETAILRATIPCWKTPKPHHRRARAPPTSMRWHEERYEAHRRPDRRSSRALVGESPKARLGLRRHFRTHECGPKNGSKQRSRSAGAPQGLVAAVAAPRPISEAFLLTMITAATASRRLSPPFLPGRGKN